MKQTTSIANGIRDQFKVVLVAHGCCGALAGRLSKAVLQIEWPMDSQREYNGLQSDPAYVEERGLWDARFVLMQ